MEIPVVALSTGASPTSLCYLSRPSPSRIANLFSSSPIFSTNIYTKPPHDIYQNYPGFDYSHDTRTSIATRNTQTHPTPDLLVRAAQTSEPGLANTNTQSSNLKPDRDNKQPDPSAGRSHTSTTLPATGASAAQQPTMTRPKPTSDPSSTAAGAPHSSSTRYYFLSNLDPAAYTWVQPTAIDDDDLTFGGKSLSSLYEEERWRQSHHHDSGGAGVGGAGGSGSSTSGDDDEHEEEEEEQRRGRERTRRRRGSREEVMGKKKKN